MPTPEQRGVRFAQPNCRFQIILNGKIKRINLDKTELERLEALFKRKPLYTLKEVSENFATKDGHKLSKVQIEDFVERNRNYLLNKGIILGSERGAELIRRLGISYKGGASDSYNKMHDLLNARNIIRYYKNKKGR